jgi:hypothetical protein
LFWINKQHLFGTAGYENYTSIQLLLLAEQDIQLLLLLLGQAPFIARAMQFGLITIKTVSLDAEKFGLSSFNHKSCGSSTIPATATLGATRMRVSMKYNGIPTA